MADLAKTRFDNVVSQFEDLLSVIEHTLDLTENSIDKIETEGYLVSADMYKLLKQQQEEQLSTLQDEFLALQSSFTTAMNEGNITKYSEDWYELCGEIQDTESEISNLNNELIETNNLIRETPWNIFDKMQEMLSAVQTESDWLIELMSDEDMFDEDTAAITEQGQATLGLHAVNYNAYMSQADDYANEIKKINKDLAEDPYNTILLDRRDELIEKQRESISAAEDEIQAMKDLASEGYDTFLSVMDKAIDKRKELLQTTKDLYDYEKNVAEQTKNIASLEKQKQALSGDLSESTRAKLQQLEIELESAKDELQNTEYDQYISDQEQMFDSLLDETELWINQRLDDIDLLLSDIIQYTNANAESIKQTLTDEVTKVGTTLTDAMNSIWDTEGAVTKVISAYDSNFRFAITTTNSTLDKIRQYLEKMVETSNAKANESSSSATSTSGNIAGSSSQSTTTSTKTTSNNTSSNISMSGDGTPRVGDKVTFASGRYYYSPDGQSPTGSKKLGQEVYITKIDNASWATKKYHISTGNTLGNGDLGWVTLDQLKGYSTGGIIDYDGLAVVHGGNKPELVLNSKDTENFIALKDVLNKVDANDLLLREDLISTLRDSVNILKPLINSTVLQNIPQQAAHSVEQNVNIEIGDIQMYGVNDPEAFATQLKYTLQNNKAVKNIIQADTLGVMTGKNNLTKFKY